jgi:hypothetical protein
MSPINGLRRSNASPRFSEGTTTRNAQGLEKPSIRTPAGLEKKNASINEWMLFSILSYSLKKMLT